MHAGDAGGIVVITQVQPISVMFTLPQQQLPTLTKATDNGVLTAHALSTDSQTELDVGALKVIDNQVDPQTGTIKLKADFPNDKRQLWPGQFVNVRLLVDTLKGVTVAPTEAVQRGPDGTFVYVVGADNTAEMRPVKFSRQDDKYAVVAEGLTAGEKIVTSGFGRLKDGSTVTLSDGNAAPAGGGSKRHHKALDGKKAADADNSGAGSTQQASQAAAEAEAALVTGSTTEEAKDPGKHHHHHRDNGASP